MLYACIPAALGGQGIHKMSPVAVAIATHLGAAYGFSVFASGGVTVAGASSANWMTGGLPPAVSGVPIGSAQHYGDALAVQVAADVQAAYNYYKSLTPAGQIFLGAAPVATAPAFAGDIAGLRFAPNPGSKLAVFFAEAAFTNSINVTFDSLGDPDVVFVIQGGAAFAPAAAATVTLVGVESSNVFWAVTGAVTCGAAAHMKGTILSLAAIGFGAGATLQGRALAYGAGAITMSANAVTTS